MRKQKLRALLTAIWLFLLAHMMFFAGVARSDYPEKPVTVIAAFDPGGPTDVSVRVLVAGAEKYLRQPIVVENRGGGGGTVALSVVSTAKPDGYTLCAATSAPIINTPLMQKVSFKPLSSFTPIVVFANSQHNGLIVKNDAPWKTFEEFLDYAKKNPGRVKYSSTGIGTGLHIAMEVIAQKEGIKWVHIPYKGTATARTALLGGHVTACTTGVDFPPYVQSGAVRVLATYGEKRSPNFPNVPTLKELGYDFVNEALQCIVGPAGLPLEVIKKLEMAFKKGMETPEFKATLERLYLTPVFMGSKEYDQHLKEKWGITERLFKETGLIKEAATQPY